MLYWALVFFVVAIVAAVFGFGGIASASAGIAQILFFVFLVLFFSALKGVYTAVLYRYAVTGEDSLFDPEIVGSAFRSKR